MGGGLLAWGGMDAATDLLIYSYNLAHKFFDFFRLLVISQRYRFFGGSIHHLIVQSSEYDITSSEPAFRIADI